MKKYLPDYESHGQPHLKQRLTIRYINTKEATFVALYYRLLSVVCAELCSNGLGTSIGTSYIPGSFLICLDGNCCCVR